MDMLTLSRKSIIVLSAFSSIAGLFIIYIGNLFTSSQKVHLGEVTSDLEGKYVSVTGKIITKSETPNNHIFLTISDENSKIQVPIFSSLVKKLESSGVQISKVRLGNWISVSGLVGYYKGQLQIVPKNPSDIKLEGDRYS